MFLARRSSGTPISALRVTWRNSFICAPIRAWRIFCRKPRKPSCRSPGKGTTELAESLLQRQYNKELPEAAARAEGQHGRVGKAFDTAFGRDMFQHSDEALLAQRRANAQQLYAPAYARNVRSAEIDDAMDRLNTLNPNILTTAQR